MKSIGKRAMQAALCVCALTAICWELGQMTGQAFRLRFPAATAWLVAGLLLVAMLSRDAFARDAGHALPMLVLTAAMSYVAVCSADSLTWRILLPLLLDMLFAAVLLLHGRGSRWLRWLAVPVLFLCSGMVLGVLLALVFPMAQRSVVLEAESPDGSRVAVVWDVDEGALGGSTLVEVERLRGGLDVGFGTFGRAPRRVYKGDWRDWVDMEVIWEDEDTLRINGQRVELSP